MITLASASRGSDNINCLVQTAPSTPYTFEALIYVNLSGAAGAVRFQPGMAFYESATGKFEVWGPNSIGTSNYSVWLNQWSNTTTIASTAFNNTYDMSVPALFKIQNDGTNLKYYSSPDGVNFIQQFSELKNAFFTTAPNQVGFCIDNNTGASAIDVDYWRRTQ